MSDTATYVPPVIRTAEDLLDALNRTKQAIYGHDYYPFTMDQMLHFSDPRRNILGYRPFTVPKKSGGRREICAPRRLLKTFQSIAGQMLQAMYEAPSEVTGFVPGRSVVDNASRHTGKNYVLCADLKDFFPGIIRMQVQAALMKAPFDLGGEAARLLSGICCTHLDLARRETEIRSMIRWGGQGLTVYDYHPEGFPSLPQGSPASPVLSNAVCIGLDRRLSGLAARFGVEYSRYADDITFSGDHNVFREGQAFMETFRRIVTEEGFELNESKLRLREKGQRQEVTGLIVNRKVNLCRKEIRSLGSLLHIWERYGYEAAYLRFLRHERTAGKSLDPFPEPSDGPDDGEGSLPGECNWCPHMVGTVQGRLAYMRMVRGADDPVWRKLDARFRKLKASYLSARPTGTRPTYLQSWRIDHFEAVTGAEFKLSRNWNGTRWICYIDWGDFRIDVSPSRYCRTRLEAAAEDPDAFRTLKGEFSIGVCMSFPKEETDHGPGEQTLRKALGQSYRKFFTYWKVFRRVPKHPRQLKETGMKERRERPGPVQANINALLTDLDLSWTSVEFTGDREDEMIYPFETEPF